MMNILLFGATGKTGREILSLLLERGYNVTAVVRDASKIDSESKTLSIIEGDATDKKLLIETAEGHDAVISALGTNSLGKTSLQTKFAENTIVATKVNSIDRIIIVSSWGVGKSKNTLRLLPRLLFNIVLRNIMKDKESAEDLIKASELRYTFVKPGRLTDGPSHKIIKASEHGSKKQSSSISRSDVATFVVDQLESENWVNKEPVIGT